MPVSRLDIIYRKLLLTKFFSRGWGSPEHLSKLFAFRKVMSNRETCYELVSKNYPIQILREEIRSDYRIIDGTFLSPFALHMSDVMVPEIQNAYFQLLLPLKWPANNYRPVCIHLAGTGDHYFWRRRNMVAKPLLKDGIAAILLENPFYGFRKPEDQIRSSVHHVSDIFVMGGCLILECIALLNWCESVGFGPLGISGFSMGGHMASLAATNWPKPLVLVPCLSWSTASSVFTEGVMSDSINWDLLQSQYVNNVLYCDKLSKLCKIVDNPFACSLSSFQEITYDLSSVLNENKACYITPHEMLNILNGVIANCPTVTYRTSSTSKRLFQLDLINLLKHPPPFRPNQKVLEMKKRAKEALWFMRGMMDECTHLKNFSVPFETSLIIAICARDDGYIPRQGISKLEDLWPGASVRYVDAGHVSAYIWYQKLFRKSIVEAFERAKKFSPPPSEPLGV